MIAINSYMVESQKESAFEGAEHEPYDSLQCATFLLVSSFFGQFIFEVN